MAELTHLDQQGHARMVDVGDKASTRRRAGMKKGASPSARALVM